MVISYDQQFLFLHVPKTGGLSVAAALGRYAHDPDQYLVNQLLAKAGIHVNHFLFGYHRRKFRRHAPARQVRRLLPKSVYDGLFKFAFVRNPWDLLVSYHRFVLNRPQHHRYQRMKQLKFRDYLRFACAKGIGFQLGFLSDRRGQLLVDYVGRFENIEHDFGQVLGYLAIKGQLPHLNQSRHAPYQDYYDRPSRDYVQSAYRHDIEQFGYAF
ncbi:MAG: hypothetical protein A2W31_16225 [Planctomycetes bacterium RBG_16_64_10]|nr:MAG: hypothetical protein A2W31_16225 [Planctomycetes bacterium RBG_16_64_10]